MKYIYKYISLISDSIQRRSIRHTLSGRDFRAFTQDLIAEFPKDKLIALYEEKIAEDEAFKNAMESLESEEWEEIYKALWNSEVFLNEVADLKANGIDIDILLDEAKAIFGKF